MKLTRNQHISFESLRGLAAILVMLGHVYQIFLAKYYPQYGYAIGLMAQSCVMVFFVMSGFLVRMSIENNISKNGFFSLSEYAASRSMRIIPPLVFCILLCFALFHLANAIPGMYNLPQDVQSVRGRMLATDSRWVISVLSFTNGFLFQNKLFNAPLWSLPFEVWFYVIAGLVCRKKVMSVIIATLLVLSFSMLRIDFMYYLIVWVLGYSLCNYRERLSEAKVLIPVLCVASLLCLYLAIKSFLSKEVDISIYNLSFGIFSGFLMFWMLMICNIKISFLNGSSKYSYTLYLIHFPVLIFTYGILNGFISNGEMHSWIAAAISIVFSIIISRTSALVFENKEKLKQIV